MVTLSLCQDLGFFTNKSIADITSFYAGEKDWIHDEHLFIILLMVQQGILLDFGQLSNSKHSLESNAINLVCGIISLLEVKLAEPWRPFDLREDKELKSFYYLSSILKDSVRNYYETSIFKLIHKQHLLDHSMHNNLYGKIKFKNENGLYFATILKSILQYEISITAGKISLPEFSKISWPWLRYTTAEDFISILREALNLWDGVYKMIMDLTEKSKVDYLRTAFINADFVLKTKIEELEIHKLLK